MNGQMCTCVPGAREDAEAADVGERQTCEPVGFCARAEGRGRGERRRTQPCVCVDDAFRAARGAAGGDDEGVPLCHRFGRGIDGVATGTVDDGVHAEGANKFAPCSVGQALVDDHDRIACVPFAHDVLGDRVRRRKIESHEFAHRYSVGWAP